MSSGSALTLTAIVPEYVGSTRRLSPAMTCVRSDGVVPQRLIHRRKENQYNTANVSSTRRVGTMAISFQLTQRHPYATGLTAYSGDLSGCVQRSRRSGARAMPGH